jgi:3-ketosteroid 9alpha-monooxygenase subunit A
MGCKMRQYKGGWFQIAFERDVHDPLSEAFVQDRRIMLVKNGDAFRAFVGDCPHRGASLAQGGSLAGDAVICPFHGYRIRLGTTESEQLCVMEYPALVAAGGIFIRLSGENLGAWDDLAARLSADNEIVAGFELSVPASMETVVENVFDESHFGAVHGVQTGDFHVSRGEHGRLIVESTFFLPRWGQPGGGMVPTQYRAVVVSPGLVAAELKGDLTYTVLTSATDHGFGKCIVRLTFAFPKSGSSLGHVSAVRESVVAHSRLGLERDVRVWKSLRPVQPRWQPADHPVRSFMAFCDLFAA